MFIQTEITPNPQALKFHPPLALCAEGSSTWTAQSDGLDRAPLAKALLDLEDVVEVLIARDHLSVRIAPQSSWATVKIFVLATISDFVEFGWPAIEEGGGREAEGKTRRRTAAERQIIEVLDASIRPAVARDGGDVKFISYDPASKRVVVELVGACSGCPSAQVTLAQGVERTLQEKLAFVHAVEQVGGVRSSPPGPVRPARPANPGGPARGPATTFKVRGAILEPPGRS